jgi:hypothetical protein
VSGTCRYCTCTDDRACEGGCSWADDAHTVCSHCQAAKEIAEKVVEVLGHLTVLRHLKTARAPAEGVTWTDLDTKSQRLLVIACRGTVEGYRDAIVSTMTEDAVTAIHELNVILDFLEASCPAADLRDEESVADTVIRLLAPHVGSRIVVAG